FGLRIYCSFSILPPIILVVFLGFCHPRRLPSFPTRRSSDLPEADLNVVNLAAKVADGDRNRHAARTRDLPSAAEAPGRHVREAGDRKSTRLNSSHGSISYAVFCLKKKNEVVNGKRHNAPDGV